ncbi:hypothetical protein SAMN02982994_1888 [Azospirillum lipoferum]|nr:hypothetical protein SAMN02982994_1888 [Azospirillum lipoferum]
MRCGPSISSGPHPTSIICGEGPLRCGARHRSQRPPDERAPHRASARSLRQGPGRTGVTGPVAAAVSLHLPAAAAGSSRRIGCMLSVRMALPRLPMVAAPLLRSSRHHSVRHRPAPSPMPIRLARRFQPNARPRPASRRSPWHRPWGASTTVLARMVSAALRESRRSRPLPRMPAAHAAVALTGTGRGVPSAPPISGPARLPHAGEAAPGLQEGERAASVPARQWLRPAIFRRPFGALQREAKSPASAILR